jgi:transcription antitermination factor NusG
MHTSGSSAAQATERVIRPAWASAAESVQWYAAYTCARHEKRVAAQLGQRAIECFLPLYRARHRWKDRAKDVDLPLFPGYVFVHMPLSKRLRALEVPGVVRLVAAQGRPLPLPEEDIERLRSGLNEQRHAQPHPFLKVGQRVRVRYGALQGLEGYLVRKKDRCRLVVSIDLILRSVALEIDGEEVEPVFQPGSGLVR